MTIEKYKLYGLLPTREGIDTISQYRFSFANSDHCLVIAEEAPKGAVELGADDYKLLDPADWQWIYSVSEAIRAEREEKYAAELRRNIDDFMARFEAILNEKVGNSANGGTEQDKPSVS